MNESQLHPGVREAQQARTELYDTLGQLRERLDYAQRVDDTLSRAKHRLAEERREHPVGFAVGAIAVAAAVGAAAWGVTRLLARRFAR